ncbi:MAG TPA: potassium/proton antiporter [Stellaceae bacterium]|nr:potassium/proton antiporter [Stellaceae bacterium]
MDFAHRWLLLAGILLLASILASKLTSRVGAPMLLVFLGLGMLVGEEGLGGIAFGERRGGIAFDDIRTAYLIGSAALSLILLDGGIRTRRASLRLALAPALSLATLGVVVTAAITGLIAALMLGRGWIEGLLVGAIVASTDAAAVFLLLHHRGARLNERVNATLEVESGVNDPVAVFLTVTAVSLLGNTGDGSVLAILRDLVQTMALGGMIGIAGGHGLVRLINRLELAAGLYPILVVAGGLVIFAGTQIVGGSGFLAVYLAGIVLGNARLRAKRLISRFIDGTAWLAQIVLFVMLGLFVSPALLLPEALPALAIALSLILVARPLAVWLSLAPFRFTAQECAFIAWVGLRGAVPIFLAMFPLLAGLPGSTTFFNIAFVVVLASLTLQGWTVGPAVRWLGLELPPGPDPTDHLEFELPAGQGREISVYRVAAAAPALEWDIRDLTLPRGTRIITVLRDGEVMSQAALDRLLPGDVVCAVVPLEQFDELDRLFSARPPPRRGAADPLGDFVLDSATRLGQIADLYGLPAPLDERDKSLADFMHGRFQRTPAVGDRLHFGAVDLVVHDMEAERISRIGLTLEPAPLPFETFRLRQGVARSARAAISAGQRLRAAIRRRP